MPPAVKILLLGDDGCGKSTFLSTINRGKEHTGGQVATRTPQAYSLRLYNREYHFTFYDVPLEGSYPPFNPSLIVLCFDVSDRSTLANAQHVWYKYASCNYEGQVPSMLLGLKRDLRTEAAATVVPYEAYRVAQELRCDRYAECSAVTGELLDEVLEDIAIIGAKTTTEAGALNEPNCSIL